MLSTSDPELLLQLAQQDLARDQLAAAQQKCLQVLGAHHHHPGALEVLGTVLGSQARYEDAVRVFNALTLMQPTVARHWEHLGTVLRPTKRYDQALALRAGWSEAQGNRHIAQLRADSLKAPGADAGNQLEGADQIVYDKDAKNPEGQESQVVGTSMDDQAVRALWLKRVRTKPADFLRARFAFQLETQQTPAGAEAPQ